MKKIHAYLPTFEENYASAFHTLYFCSLSLIISSSYLSSIHSTLSRRLISFEMKTSVDHNRKGKHSVWWILYYLWSFSYFELQYGINTHWQYSAHPVVIEWQSFTDELYVDCLVSEWGEWSPCGKTCGFGTRQRSREIMQMPANRGNSCPLLTEESMCGSMRNCKWSHFSAMGNKMGSSFRGPRGRRRRRRKFS